jgi:hypothetical protein
MNDRDIIVIGLQPYDNAIGSKRINIADEFALNNVVPYINYAFDGTSIRREKNLLNIKKRIEMRSEKKGNLNEINANLWVFYEDTLLESVNWGHHTFLFKIFNFINNARIKNEIKKFINRLKFNDFIISTTTISLCVFT